MPPEIDGTAGAGATIEQLLGAPPAVQNQFQDDATAVDDGAAGNPLEAYLQTDEGKAFFEAAVGKIAQQRQRQFSRDVVRASRGDEAAMRALERSPQGRQVLRSLQEDAPRQAGAHQADLNDSRRQYHEVLAEKRTNPQAYWERINHPQYGQQW